jgi:hypothetical protein
MYGGFLSRSLESDTERKAGPMNPNQMMIAKAMVAQTAFRDEARESRRRPARDGLPRGSRKNTGLLELLRRR